jgi:galactokinase
MNPALTPKVAAAFAHHFGAPPQALVQAPGRVNLIGEHTDYNHGFVLPCAIDRGTVIAVSARSDTLVRALALDFDSACDEFDLTAPISPRSDSSWPNHVRGVVAELVAAGLVRCGVDLVIAGDVPTGAGLSSSASLEVALVQAFKTSQGLSGLDPTTMARLAQQAENNFVGCRCGIMDPLIAALGQAGHALLIDCDDNHATPVRLADELALMVVHSNVRRGLVDSEYNLRRQQCEAAARHYGVASLREVDLQRLVADRRELDDVIFRRARHIVSENARTLAAAAALRGNDLRALGVLMAASHASMRDDFEITVAAVDELAEIAQRAIGDEGGARMTGGGFGGCVVALMPARRFDAVSAAVLADYRSPLGLAATVYLCQASAGAGAIEMR